MRTEPEALNEELRLRRQWAIYPCAVPFRRGWKAHPIDESFTLHVHDCAKLSLQASDKRKVMIIGLAVKSDEPELSDENIIKELLEVESDHFNVYLASLAGTYVIIRIENSGTRLYTDPAGMMNVFYRAPFVASTPTLIPELERDARIDAEYTLRGSDSWYPGSITPFVGVKVLLANHLLNLSTWCISRFWPQSEFKKVSYEEGVSRLAQVVRGTAQAFVHRRAVLCSITGGRDSRVNLAALRYNIHDVEFFTIRGGGVNRRDVSNAKKLVRRFDLEHQFVEVRPATSRLYEFYDEMTSGMSIGARREIIGGCWALQGEDVLHLNGNLGALAKAYYRGFGGARSINLDVLAKEFVHSAPCIMEGLREWTATVPDLETASLYNLMYLEQRGGRWMGIGETASNLFYESGSVFCSRQVFECICGMPSSSQGDGRLLENLVGELWPELLEVPYSSGTTMLKRVLPKKLKYGLSRVAQFPKLR